MPVSAASLPVARDIPRQGGKNAADRYFRACRLEAALQRERLVRNRAHSRLALGWKSCFCRLRNGGQALAGMLGKTPVRAAWRNVSRFTPSARADACRLVPWSKKQSGSVERAGRQRSSSGLRTRLAEPGAPFAGIQLLRTPHCGGAGAECGCELGLTRFLEMGEPSDARIARPRVVSGLGVAGFHIRAVADLASNSHEAEARAGGSRLGKRAADLRWWSPAQGAGLLGGLHRGTRFSRQDTHE